ncbi:PTS sugar transporter subunit IIA [Candidatus Enterococcus murrayae]|uniref:PTS mannose/fructose/sorbose family IIA subunit n=1 Tax=Candidatus Enterococcus murrayae TaxID=2815321 RepID=A0ABS3HHL7_9ENTE|nr:PTS mannose/fructose/sorbose family IIA subunit [Enterococcus sp. MJM16]MBO0452929.1 PTS mannose/fructose/sorbose family IIA subunit [Enterococcus sp. MJM16]
MIILCGHGKYGETIKNSLEMIAGKQEHIYTVDFTEDMSVSDILERYNERISVAADNVSIYCDIPGGSPANAALLAKRNNEGVRVFTGLNLSMMLSLVMGEEIAQSLIDAKESIKEL